MKKTYLEEIVRCTIIGSIGWALLLGIIFGLLESIVGIEIPSNLNTFIFSFSLSFIICNILYVFGNQISKRKELEDEVKGLKRKIDYYENN